MQPGPKSYAEHPKLFSRFAIGSLAGQVARLDHGAHLGLGEAGVGAEGRPARGRAGGQARWPRRLGENLRGGGMLGNKRLGEVL
jgi:hypothetical protein